MTEERNAVEAELKPCPFCGSPRILTMPPTCKRGDTYDRADRAMPVARCLECFAEVLGDNWDATCDSAIAAWNRRTPDWRGREDSTVDGEMNKQMNILKAQSALRGRLLQEVRNKIGPLVMDLEDEGDRIYLGSTNDKEWLEEIEQTIFEVDDEVWATLNQEETDPYADLYDLRVNIIPAKDEEIAALRNEVDRLRSIIGKLDAAETWDDSLLRDIHLRLQIHGEKYPDRMVSVLHRNVVFYKIVEAIRAALQEKD